jgi:hypothetical protein
MTSLIVVMPMQRKGWPKFVSNSFVTTPDGSGLVHLYMGPLSTSVTLTGGKGALWAGVT